MMALFRTEVVKQVRRTRTYVALGLMVAIPAIIALALHANPPRHRGDDGLFFLSQSTGLVFPAAALGVMSRFLLVAVIAMFAGDAIASEASWGNLRALLVRPIPRGRLLAAKLAVVVLLGVVTTLVLLVAALGVGVAAFGWHPLDVGLRAAPGAAAGAVTVVPSLGLHLSVGSLLGRTVLAGAYVFWSLSGILVFGFFVSTLTDSPGGAIGGAFGLYVVSAILDAISSLGILRAGLPTHELEAWRPLFVGGAAGGEMLRGLVLQVPYVVVFGALAWWWFGRKDVLS